MTDVFNNKEPKNKIPWPDPTPEMLNTPEFEAVWQCIKKWDINVPDVDGEGLYSGATGNHVRAILDALKDKAKETKKVTIEQLEQILNDGKEPTIEIFPNGRVHAKEE